MPGRRHDLRLGQLDRLLQRHRGILEGADARVGGEGPPRRPSGGPRRSCGSGGSAPPAPSPTCCSTGSKNDDSTPMTTWPGTSATLDRPDETMLTTHWPVRPDWTATFTSCRSFDARSRRDRHPDPGAERALDLGQVDRLDAPGVDPRHPDRAAHAKPLAVPEDDVDRPPGREESRPSARHDQQAHQAHERHQDEHADPDFAIAMLGPSLSSSPGRGGTRSDRTGRPRDRPG